MSFSLTPGKAGKVTFHFQHSGPAKPTDYHIYLIDPDETDIDHAKRLIDANVLPEDQDPLAGISLDYYPGSPNFPIQDGRLRPGTYTYALVWSFGGERPNEEDKERPKHEVFGQDRTKYWSWEDAGGKALGGAIASGIFGGVLNAWTGAAILPCIATGIAGGALGGFLGYLLAFYFDDPKIRWDLRSSFLFSFFYTLAFAMVLGLLAVDLEVKWAEQGEVVNRVTLGVSVISSMLAGCLAGVLNNLRDGRED